MSEPITIVGGGLAGLSLGIGLLQHHVPVTLWEAGNYPRHRVCGEFICGKGLGFLDQLGMLEIVRKAGACSAATAAFYSGNSRFAGRPIPQPALCVSRFLLDETLANEFRRRGGSLRAGERWRGECGTGVVRASGRRIQPAGGGWRWLGLKAHAGSVILAADLELHLASSRYVGLCRLANGQVNVCGLFRSKAPLSGVAQHWRAWLSGSAGSALHERLAGAEWEEGSFCSVSGFTLRPQRAASREDCCVGDAMTMIPPLTGNGMSMAFESAELALEPLLQFSRGSLSWSQARQTIAQACDRRFARRLRWASWLQRALFLSPTRLFMLWTMAHSGSLWRSAFRLTR